MKARYTLCGLFVIVFLICVAKLIASPNDLFESRSETLDHDVALWMTYEVTPQLEVRRRLYEACIVKWQYAQLVDRKVDRVGTIPDDIMEACHKEAWEQTKWREFEEWREAYEAGLLKRPVSATMGSHKLMQTTGLPEL
ncbi:hypothetical protein [Pseudomonas phage D6]|nr:hypothetical protein [Pseudomonas phage D6]